ncbi:hypothetical protein ARMGADRAFT_796205 [Armillaria gallica]|uniref:C2H2-type domain-containing protein n=1 Tax=Armillaria gallica TaxID=47427 RepID=A0A2H3DMM1_ARMGA|nr:hypothetical protein ARMGADRAFT_796205 [Armillaria gallica]
MHLEKYSSTFASLNQMIHSDFSIDATQQSFYAPVANVSCYRSLRWSSELLQHDMVPPREKCSECNTRTRSLKDHLSKRFHLEWYSLEKPQLDIMHDDQRPNIKPPRARFMYKHRRMNFSTNVEPGTPFQVQQTDTRADVGTQELSNK